MKSNVVPLMNYFIVGYLGAMQNSSKVYHKEMSMRTQHGDRAEVFWRVIGTFRGSYDITYG